MANLFCMRIKRNISLCCCRECKDREEIMANIAHYDVGTYCVKYNAPVHPYLIMENTNESEQTVSSSSDVTGQYKT